MQYTLSKHEDHYTIEFEDDGKHYAIMEENEEFENCLGDIENNISCGHGDNCLFQAEEFQAYMSHDAHLRLIATLRECWDSEQVYLTCDLDRS